MCFLKKQKKNESKKVPKKENKKHKKDVETKNSNARVYHVSKRSDGKWTVKYAGGEKVIKLFNTQNEAIEYTKEMAKNQNGAMLVHNSKGKNKGRIQ